MNTHNPTPELAADYYLGNFQLLIDWVDQHYSDLLNQQERKFLENFRRLTLDGKRLLVRLSSRKGPFFRNDKLHYSEIVSIDQAADELIDVGLLNNQRLLGIQDVTNLLTKMELADLFHDLKISKTLKKEALVSFLFDRFPEPRTWQDWTNGKFGDVYHLDNQPLISHFLLLFFGNAYQDLTEFVLQDLGLFRYENYLIDYQHRIFKNRDEVDQYKKLVQLRELLDQATSDDHLILLANEIPPPYTNDKLERRRARLCNQLAYALERINQYQRALELYQQNHLPPARERRIRLLEKQGNYVEAWALLNEIMQKPCDEQEVQIAQRMSPRLAKKLGLIIDRKKSPAVVEQQLKLQQLTDGEGNYVRVEEIVRQSIHISTSPCFYVENLLLTGLFGLWLWPEMFRGIEGAFANPFQSAPLDLYQENFVTARPDINRLWLLLENNEHSHHIRQLWREKNGITNHFVNWQFLNEEILENALLCIPAAHLKAIFERLLFDIKNNRSGLPDLIQFYPDTNSYRMIEVKGPGDRIQDNQQRWLDYFAQKMIPAEVWYVNWE